MRPQLQAILSRALAAMCREIDPDHGLLRELVSEGVLSDEQAESCKPWAKPTRAERVEEMVRFIKLRDDSAYEKFRQILCQFDQQQFVNEYLPSTEGDEPKLNADLLDGVSRKRIVAATFGEEFAPTVAEGHDNKRRRSEDEKGRPRGITSSCVAASIVVLAAAAAAVVGYMKFSAMEKPSTDPLPSPQSGQPGEQSKEQNLFRAAFKSCRAKLVSDIDVEHDLLLHMRDKGVLTGDHVADIKSYKTPSAMVGRMLDLLERRDNVHFKGFCDALIDSDQKSIVDRYLRTYYP